MTESEQSMRHLIQSNNFEDLIQQRITDPDSGKGSDELCQWFYESYQSGDLSLQAAVLQYIPTLCSVYLIRTYGANNEPLPGFEAVLLALYNEEARFRGGRPLMIRLPNLSQPSLYHTPPVVSGTTSGQPSHTVEQLSAALEPQTTVKSTQRALIVGVALDLFSRRIAVMPQKSKLEFCRHARRWAVQGCSWAEDVDNIARLAIHPFQPVAPPPDAENIPELGHAMASGEPLAVSQAVFEQPPHHRTVESSKVAHVGRTGCTTETGTTSAGSSFNSAQSVDLEDEVGVKLSLEMDLLRPIFKVLGHCLMSPTSSTDLKEAAISAAHAFYVRASEDLNPEAIFASRSLVRLGAASNAKSKTGGTSFTSSDESIAADQIKSEVLAES